MLLIVHGGASDKRPDKGALHKLSESLMDGYKILSNGGTALDTVIESIVVLEDSGIFNAGTGGNLQFDGVRRLDASLMEGRHLKAGSVIGLEGIRNPIRAARLVMDSPHVILTNIGARKIADVNKLAPLPEADEASLRRLEEIKKKEEEVVKVYEEYYSTVGAVAMDMHGNLASGSSTGGTLAMLPGRVGDTPIIGSGVYAENPFGAVSCTGKGEDIVRLSLAKEISMNLKGMSPNEAAALSLQRLIKIDGRAGVILIDRNGQFAIRHTTQYMASGYIKRALRSREDLRR